MDISFLYHALPIIRRDYNLYETYDFKNWEFEDSIENCVKIPISAIAATQDISLEESSIKSWGSLSSEFTYHRIEGTGHFYLLDKNFKEIFYDVILSEVSTSDFKVRV